MTSRDFVVTSRDLKTMMMKSRGSGQAAWEGRQEGPGGLREGVQDLPTETNLVFPGHFTSLFLTSRLKLSVFRSKSRDNYR